MKILGDLGKARAESNSLLDDWDQKYGLGEFINIVTNDVEFDSFFLWESICK